jgi:Ran GTPase-activating protein (RanGAP) involved in mRNA processing and transport
VGFFHKEVCPELLDLRFAGTPGAGEEDEEEDAKMLQLDLSCIGIGDERVVSVAAALKQIQLFRTLQLDLDFTKFNFTFATNVALTDNAYPMQINLSGNDIGDAGAKSLAKALRVYSGIIHVDLQNNGISDYGVQSLADVLKSNESIVEMKLWGNPILESGARVLFNAFQANHAHAAYLHEARPEELIAAFKCTFEIASGKNSVNMSDHSLGDAGAKAVAETLRENKTLQIIDLSGNNIGPEGAKELAEALKVNGSLKEIYLRGNQIGDEGAKALAEAEREGLTILT